MWTSLEFGLRPIVQHDARRKENLLIRIKGRLWCIEDLVLNPLV